VTADRPGWKYPGILLAIATKERRR